MKQPLIKPKSFVVPFRLDQITYKMIVRECKKENITISQYIRNLIYKHLKTNNETI